MIAVVPQPKGVIISKEPRLLMLAMPTCDFFIGQTMRMETYAVVDGFFYGLLNGERGKVHSIT